MADTITIRTDDETEHALDVLTHDGSSRSAAIRQAVLDQIDLIDLDQRIGILARTVQPVTVRRASGPVTRICGTKDQSPT